MCTYTRPYQCSLNKICWKKVFSLTLPPSTTHTHTSQITRHGTQWIAPRVASQFIEHPSIQITNTWHEKVLPQNFSIYHVVNYFYYLDISTFGFGFDSPTPNTGYEDEILGPIESIDEILGPIDRPQLREGSLYSPWTLDIGAVSSKNKVEVHFISIVKHLFKKKLARPQDRRTV